MHGIAATKLADRVDIFWTDPDLQILQRTSNGADWLGWYALGGRFATAPAAVATTARRELVVSPGDANDAGGGAPGGGGGGGGGGGRGRPHVDDGSRAPHRTDRASTHDGPSVAAALVRRGPTGLGDPGGLLEQRIDVFAVGEDYAMYAKTLWGAGADRPGAWSNLGGIFTSAPAVIAWNAGGNDRIDVFGLGTDHAMFQKTWNGSAWTPDWTRLGGTFSSTASLVSWGRGRLDVFARGADFTLRHRAMSGEAWANDWQNLGGSLASEPVAVTWGPDRLDVFAVFHDGKLWHRWWDGMIWNDWESLGGRNATGGTFTSAPSAAASSKDHMAVFVTGDDLLVYQFSWSAGAWAGPETLPERAMTSSPSVITSDGILDLFVPGTDQNVYHRRFDGANWQPTYWSQMGGHIRLPSRYRVAVEYVTAETTRSLISDTDTASATLAVGNWPANVRTQPMGEIGGTHPSQAQLQQVDFEPVTIELCESAIFTYLVVNNGNAGQKELNDALANAGISLTDDARDSVAKDLSAGAAAVVGVWVGGNIAAPIIGSLVGALSGWLMGKLGAAAFADCDGIVAGQLFPRLGRDLHRITAAGPYRETTSHPGTGSPFSCGAESDYAVTWSITRV